MDVIQTDKDEKGAIVESRLIAEMIITSVVAELYVKPCQSLSKWENRTDFWNRWEGNTAKNQIKIFQRDSPGETSGVGEPLYFDDRKIV